MQELLIVGAGPAGCSAALYAARAGRKVTVLYKDMGALAKAERIENYYGLAEPVSGSELFARGMEGAARLGVRFVQTEVVAAEWDGNYKVTATDGVYTAPALLLATGTARKTPPIPGVRELEGRGVSYCAVCDAFFYRGLTVAVLGAGEYALHEAAHLAQVAGQVLLLTDGEPAPEDLPEKVTVHTGKLAAVEGTDKVTGVRFGDGSRLACEGFFVALGTAGSGELARKLGAEVENNTIITEKDGATALPGLYAAGDCTGGLLQVAKAVHEGAAAGMAIAKYLRSL